MIIEVGSDTWERYDVVFRTVERYQQAETGWTPPELILDEVAVTQSVPKDFDQQFTNQPTAIKQEDATDKELPQPQQDTIEPKKLIVGEAAPERLPQSSPDQKEPIIRSAICPFCTKRFNAIGWEFVDKIYTCPFCNNEATAKDFVGYKKKITLPPLTPPPLTIPSFASSTTAAPASTPISEGVWMAAKIVYAVLMIPLFMVLYGSVLGLNSPSYYSSRSVRVNDLIIYLVVTAIFVAIGFSGKILDKRVNLKYGNGMKKEGWRRMRPVRIAILTIIALVVGPFLFGAATA
jgi:hypothetical protein